MKTLVLLVVFFSTLTHEVNPIHVDHETGEIHISRLYHLPEDE